MTTSPNFVEKYLNGEAYAHDIDDHVDTWHDSKEQIGLHEYLGLSWVEYCLWVQSPSKLKEILESRKV